MIIIFKFLFNIYKNFLQLMYMQRIYLSTGTCIFVVGICNIYLLFTCMQCTRVCSMQLLIEDI